jgi:predicted Zn-dependent protease
VEEVVSEYGSLSSPFSENYFSYLGERLARSQPADSQRLDIPEIVLINNPAPMAGTPGTGVIVLSHGLVRRLHNEGELAFVLAHEFAHQILGHKLTPETSDGERHDLELEADKRALALIAVAGYDPRVSVGALIHSAGVSSIWESSPAQQGYPALEERIEAMRKQVNESSWSPPGTIDRRDFQKLRSSVG